MKIEAGKYYRTRDGRKVGPVLKRDPESSNPHNIGSYPFTAMDRGKRKSYAPDGSLYNLPDDSDLIEPWEDEAGEGQFVFEDERDTVLRALWDRDEGTRDLIRASLPKLAARMESPAPRSGTVWLNVWLNSNGNVCEWVYPTEAGANVALDSYLSRRGGQEVVRARAIEWTEDE